ncbi:hypothetical protein BCR43DRAFT_447227, partial [Syncephalastrum racemosum]
EHLLVKDFDVTKAFHELRLSICDHKWKLSFENHIHTAMAASYVLLLSEDPQSEDIAKYFTEEQLKATIVHIDNKYRIKKPRLPTQTAIKILEVIEDVTQGTTSREDAIIRLFSLRLPENENNFKNSIIQLMRKLLRQSITEDTNEHELCTS